jgi:hypothetical protein
MDGHGSISKHGLRSGRGKHHKTITFLERIFEMVELSQNILVLHLQIGESGLASRTPIDDVVTPVDEAFPVEPNKYFFDRFGEALIHGEPFTTPVTGGSESLQLTDDRSPGLLFPFPDPLDEFLPAQGVAVQASFQELFLHDVLCGNACVVRSWHPEGIVPPHPLEPDQDILQGIVQGVSDMEGACYIGRRDDNGIGFPV